MNDREPVRVRESAELSPVLQGRLLMIGPKTGATVMGVSVAFDMLADFLKQRQEAVREVNLTQRGEVRAAGRFQIGRALFTVSKVLEAWLKMLWASKVYIVVATSTVGFYRDFLMILGAAVLRRKVLIHLHGGGYRDFYATSPPFRKRLIRWMLRRTDGVIVLGELLKNQFDFIDPPLRLFVVPNGLPDPGSSTQVGQIKQAPPPGEPWRILYLSNLMETKGYLVLLDAVEELVQEGRPCFQVDYCGGFVQSVAESSKEQRSPVSKESFLQRIQRPPLDHVVKYHGTVGGQEKTKRLTEAHVLVLPTWYPWEGQPLSIIEAMAFGIPVISTAHAGIPEQIVPGETGFLLTPEATTGPRLAEVLRSLMSMDPTAYQAMSRAAVDFYRAHFTRERHLEKMLEVINAV